MDPVDPGRPLWTGLWQRRLLEPGNRPAPLTGPPAIDVWTLLGGQPFFDRVFDRQPWVLAVQVPQLEWPRIVAEAAASFAGQGRVDRWSANGMERAVPPDALGDVDQILEAASNQLIAVRDTHWEIELLQGWHDAFRAFFGCPVTTGLYLNGVGAAGFPEHHDAHHVFATQLSGTKRWTVGPPILPNPSRRYDWPGQQETVTSQVDTPVGRMLYMPPGVRHRAEVVEGPSVHITFGVHVPRALDWLETALVDGGRRFPELRARLPMRVGPGGLAWDADPQAMSALIAKAIATQAPTAILADGTRVGARQVAEIRGAWPMSDGAFEVLDVPDGIELVDRARRAAIEVVDEVASVRAVYVRGSALEDRDESTVFDLDLAIVFDGNPTPEDLEATRAILDRHDDPACPFDARPVRVQDLADPQGSFLGLCLAVRSVLLAGEAIWDEPPSIPAGPVVARALAAETIGLWKANVARIYATPAAAGTRAPPEAVAWLQKRALRLIAAASLAMGGPYTRHPVGCEQLAARGFPEDAALAHQVCAALLARDGSNEALANALELGSRMISRFEPA